MINWNIIPMTYNDSFTYMEWLGKLNYIAENHEERIDAAEKEIVDLWTKVNDHEERIGELEDWRTDIVDPFIEATTETLADHEERITTNEGDIQNLKTWKDDTVDPFIVDIGDWKEDTVDPFIISTSEELDLLNANAIAESSARRNADDALDEKINRVNSAATEALSKVNKIDIDLQNIGTIRYFMDTATITADGGDTTLSVVLPDNDWTTCDVRFLADGKEYRITGTIEDTALTVEVNGITFTFAYDNTTRALEITAGSTTWTSADLIRFDYILYKGALTQAAQDQRDIDVFDALDIDENEKIDARDASFVLSYYADASTGMIPEGLEGKDAWTWWVENVHPDSQLNPDSFPDFNDDGKIDARDASSILAYYAWLSTTDTTGLTGPQALKKYKTELEAGNV